jgi:D-serine dehydratase
MHGFADGENKGLGAATAERWNLLREDLSLPVAVLSETRIAHNLAWMQDFLTRYGVKLAPHGKTTMAPQLFARQIQGGAWGITLATASQTQAAHTHGVRRVLLANQLVGRRNMEIIADLLRDPAFSFCCVVDSVANVQALAAYFTDRGQHLDVLLELGVQGGRTGVRNDAQVRAVLGAIAASDGALRLRGLELYEGVLTQEAEVRTFLRRAVGLAEELAQQGTFAADAPMILSGAGSAWYDVVAEEFSQVRLPVPLDIVLRPGCYLTHDVGAYKVSQSRIDAHNPIAREMQSSLLPALQVWAYVQSIPEPDRAIIGLGKRDAAFDSGMPMPDRVYRPGAAGPVPCSPHWEVTGMMDQHAYLRIAAGDDVAVGDMIAFDICHPCLTFDKWRVIPVVDDAFDVVEVIRTYF